MWQGTPTVGSVVGGKYRLTRALGGGGMSQVFAAENTVTNKRVALKFLLASLADKPDARARLLREARASSRIKHRNVVDVYDVGFEGETIFLVMDLLEGDTLATVLETTRMGVAALLRLLVPAMRGVAEAHRQGVIHRDIKPDNIFLAREVDHPEPIVTVLDFGIAKMDDDALRTRSGNAAGTPVFMSIEQIRGARDLDARVDVYGFGVILYMALAGRLPVVAQSYPELIYKLTSGVVPPLSLVRPELPEELSAIVARAMSREREDRTPTLEQLIGELTPFAEAGEELGFTREVRYGQDLAPMPTTMPSDALPNVEPLRTPTAQGPVRTRRRPLAWIGAAALGLVIASTLKPSTKPRAIATSVAPALVEPVVALVAHEQVASPPVSPPIVDAGLAPLRKPAQPRARKLPPQANPPARRRLASEDFFGSVPER